MEKTSKFYLVEYDVRFRPKILQDFEGKPIVFGSEEEAEVMADGLMLCAGRFVRVVETPGPAPCVEDLTISGLSHGPANPSCPRAAGCFEGRMAAQKPKAKGGSR